MSAKRDMMRQIEASVQRKKELAKEISQEKTVAHLVAQFFSELDRIEVIRADSQYLPTMMLGILRNKLRSIDPNVHAELIADAGEYRVEIQWSPQYVEKHSCEPITVLDASSALFQAALEKI